MKRRKGGGSRKISFLLWSIMAVHQSSDLCLFNKERQTLMSLRLKKSNSMSWVLYLKCTFSVWQSEIKTHEKLKINHSDERRKLYLSALCNCEWSISPMIFSPCNHLILLFLIGWDTLHAGRGRVDQWQAVKILMTELDQTFFSSSKNPYLSRTNLSSHVWLSPYSFLSLIYIVY